MTMCDPMDFGLPGSSVHGIFQARVLEWVAISFSMDLPDLGIEPSSPALQADALPSEPPGKPKREEGDGRIKYLKSLSPGTLPLSGTADSEQMSSLTSGRDRRHEEGEPGQRPEREKACTGYRSAAAADASLRRAPV